MWRWGNRGGGRGGEGGVFFLWQRPKLMFSLSGTSAERVASPHPLPPRDAQYLNSVVHVHSVGLGACGRGLGLSGGWGSGQEAK
jgi:hypothetical protein